jgi:hypothetical protein
MARFSISMSVEIEADSYEAAMEIERSLHEFIQGHDETLGVYGIDVEQTDGFEDIEE